MATTTTEDRRLEQDRLRAADARHVLHPMSAHRPASQGPIFVSGRGSWLEDALGQRYLDAFSGLMNVNLGYGRSELAAVAAAQMERLQFSPLFFGYGHEPAIALAERLAELTSPAINRFHYTNGGSEAIETAVKLARQHFAVRGQPGKQRVIGRRGSYHGATYGALSWTGIPLYAKDVGERLNEVDHVAPLSVDAIEAAILSAGPENVAALIAEPVSMSAGLAIPSQQYWTDVQALVRKYDIRLVLDEVVTGLGRTGRWFGAEHWGIEPDFHVMAKGLTSGYATLGAVGIAEPIAAELMERTPLFNSGFTMAGNQVACAVALAGLDIIRREDLLDRATTIGALLRDRIDAELGDLVRGVRSIGLLVGFELADVVAARARGADVVSALLEQRVLARAYANTIVIGPPLVAGSEEVELLVCGLGAALELAGGPR